MTPTSHDVRPRSRSASPLVHPGKSTSGQQNVARSDSHSPPSRHQDIHPTQKDHDPRHHHRQHHRSHHHHRERTKARHPPQGAPIILPYNNAPLSKQALPQCRSLFALYLDVQKQRLIEDVPEDEVRGRWKSFVGKWYGFPLLPEQRHVRLTPRADILQLVLTKTCHARNRGELSDGWYDPSTWQRAEAGAVEAEETHTGEGTGDEKAAEPGKKRKRSSPTDSPSRPVDTKSGPDADGRAKRADSSDCEIGPSLPLASRGAKDRSGPSIPRAGDLQLQRGMSPHPELNARISDITSIPAYKLAIQRHERRTHDSRGRIYATLGNRSVSRRRRSSTSLSRARKLARASACWRRRRMSGPITTSARLRGPGWRRCRIGICSGVVRTRGWRG